MKDGIWHIKLWYFKSYEPIWYYSKFLLNQSMYKLCWTIRRHGQKTPSEDMVKRHGQKTWSFRLQFCWTFWWHDDVHILCGLIMFLKNQGKEVLIRDARLYPIRLQVRFDMSLCFDSKLGSKMKTKCSSQTLMGCQRELFLIYCYVL